jgi:hypothetical protein
VWSRLSARFARCSTTGGCGPFGVRPLGLVCPLASLAARPPPRMRPATGVRPLVSSVRSLRSLLDHRGLRSLRRTAPWSRLFDRCARCSTTGGCGLFGVRPLGLVYSIAALAARPPVVAARLSTHGPWVSSDRSLRSLLDHLVPEYAHWIGWFRDARFARCSTTGGCGPLVDSRPLVSSDRSLRSLLDHPRMRPATGVRRWSRLSARFARCSTTGGCGDLAAYGAWVSCVRSLLDHLGSRLLAQLRGRGRRSRGRGRWLLCRLARRGL